MTSCAKMSNLQQHYPSRHLSFLPVCWLNTFSMAETLKNLNRLAQQWCREMTFAHLLLRPPPKKIHLFGIKFHYENHSHILGISPFEFARFFGFNDDLTYRLSQPANRFCLDAAIPGWTLEWLREHVHPILRIFEILPARYSL